MVTPGQNNTWAQGHIDPWWGLQHRSLNFTNEPFNDAQALTEWRSLGYTQARFTGDMYDMRKSKPDWLNDFDLYFPLRHLSWSVYRMRPGDVLPEHRDTYEKFKMLYSVGDSQTITRAVVFLEDWQSGHYLEMNQVPLTNWSAGDWVCWRDDFPHLAANMGKTDRYTLQLTGLL